MKERVIIWAVQGRDNIRAGGGVGERQKLAAGAVERHHYGRRRCRRETSLWQEGCRRA